MLETNELKLKLSGTANLSKELELTKTYDLVIKNAEVRKAEDLPNDDNTLDRQFTVKISELSEVSLIGQRDNVIHALKKGSQAQKLRFELQQEADLLGIDREQHYQTQMAELIKQIKERNEN